MPREFKIVSILPGCLLVFSGLFTVSLCGQNKDVLATGDQAVYGADGSVQVPLTDEAQFGVMLHTQGVGLTARRGFYQNAFRIKWWGVDVLTYKNPKEERTSNPVYEDGRPYVYGKVNTLQMLRLWRGGQKLRSEKLRKDAVRFSTQWRCGISLGVLKPVYMEIGYPDIPYDYIATERYDPDEHFSNDIYGQAAWMNGLDELRVVPGLHGSYGLDFEYGGVRHVQRTLAVGLAVDAFLESPEIFAEKFEQNNRFFVTLFATFEIGGNWTR